MHEDFVIAALGLLLGALLKTFWDNGGLEMRIFQRRRTETTPRPSGLLGPDIPPDFEDNGCGVLGTRLLDFGGIFSWCGRIHDYEWAQAAKIVDPFPPHLKVKRDIAHYEADRNLQANVRTMTRRGRRLKRAFGRVAGPLYFYAVRLGSWWVTKPGNKVGAIGRFW